MVQRIAVLGKGKVTRRSAVAMVEDFVEATKGDHRLLLPVPEQVTPLVRYVSDWAIDMGVPIEALVPQEETEDSALEEILESSVRAHVTDSRWTDSLIGLLSPGDKILLAYGEGDPDSDHVLALAARMDVDCYDLTDGMTRLVWEDEDAPEEPQEAPEDPEAAREDPEEEPEPQKPAHDRQLTFPITVHDTREPVRWHPDVSKIVDECATRAMHKISQALDDMKQEIYHRLGEL